MKSSGGLDIPFLASLLKSLKPSGCLVVPSEIAENVSENLKLAGFVNISTKENGKMLHDI